MQHSITKCKYFKKIIYIKNVMKNQKNKKGRETLGKKLFFISKLIEEYGKVQLYYPLYYDLIFSVGCLH